MKINESLLNICESLITENTALRNRVKKLEIQIGIAEQYSRRNNIVMKGIPTNIVEDKLEEEVIKILKKIDVAVSPDEIEATHRLGKTKENTIVRFILRKIASRAIVSRKKLKGQNPFIGENFCPFLSKIHYSRNSNVKSA